MATLTLSISDFFRNELKQILWVNWSEVAREESLKKIIFDRYIKTGELSDEDWEFCEKIDWHPVDELPLKEEFRKELEERKKGPFIKMKSIGELFR
ncbi:MAG TPA: hypothetical protein VJG31_00010 [Candidatus Nanoarchaeia archaeon]|nr:hypothetical protein [Candidatus Nanoarchaeia archaeon]